MKTRFIKVVFMSFLICSITESLHAQNFGTQFQITPYSEFKIYNWKEFQDNGSLFLEESGLLFQEGFTGRISFLKAKNLYVEPDLKFFFGKVDYDGSLQTQGGGLQPYKSKTAYFGLIFNANAGYIITLSKNFQIAPVAGLGIEYYNRDLDDGGQYGYDEKYTIFKFRIGGNGTYLLNKNIQIFSGLYLKIPISISESIDLASRGQGGPSDISLSPGKNPIFYIEAGTSIYRAFFKIYFESWTLSKSEPDRGYLQPESVRKLFGIVLGYTLLF